MDDGISVTIGVIETIGVTEGVVVTAGSGLPVTTGNVSVIVGFFM